MTDKLPFCIGFVDGTEIKLEEAPSVDAESYYSRKSQYSMKLQAVCDDSLKIRHVVIGYPGSVHDARIYKNCDLAEKEKNFFSDPQYILGDSAYKLTSTVMTPYRRNSKQMTKEKRSDFNGYVAHYRIKIEQCFGLLKERFGSLKGLRIRVKNESSRKAAILWILVCVIIHNILVTHFNFEKENILNLFEDDDDEEINEDEFADDDEVAESAEMKRKALYEVLLEK